MESTVVAPAYGAKGGGGAKVGKSGEQQYGYFQMPLHSPRYTKSEYETMPEGVLDRLLSDYGLPLVGNVQQKHKFAMGAFLWTY